MNVTVIKNIINSSLPIAVQEYKGLLDSKGVRNDFGVQKWEQDWHQKYTGTFCNDILNKYGTYEWLYGKEKYVYEGKIYGNNEEGYGIVSYPDGSYFQGLFKRNKRYGPGIYTYPDGNQDVGLWDGTSIIRLSISVESPVPRLAYSLKAKAYLSRYKKIIPVKRKIFDFAGQVLEKLNASDRLKKKKYRLYNNLIRYQKSVFFNECKFQKQYFSDEPEIVSIFHSIEDDEIKEYKFAEEIIAWNNEKLAVSILKHTFLHRNYEGLVNYCVDDILKGIRENFAESGPLETASLQLLEHCIEGNSKEISKLITENDLNPNVCDILGNTGLHIAVTNNHWLTITTLVTFGANVDMLNDEGLTPLLTCILLYIVAKEKVRNLEVTFLPPIGESNAIYWRSTILHNLSILEVSDEVEEKYILSLECEHPPPPPKQKKKKKEKKPKEKKKKQKVEEPVEPEIDPEQEALEAFLITIFNTISLLLYHGANPNYGKVPLPPLIFSIFTKNDEIILELIKAGADCNIRTSPQDGYLTPLHIVCSLQPYPEMSQVADILLRYGSLPNPRSKTNHWEEEKFILDPEYLCEDLGKTPLHILCMRYDYILDLQDYMGQLYITLIQNGSDPNLFYLGHTCLSLAVVRGNVRLIGHILDLEIDPNQALGCNMGIPLTVLILKRYKQILPVPNCKEVYQVLNKYNANPFVKIVEEKNAIEFCDEENAPELIIVAGKKPKKSKANKKDPHRKVIKLLYDLAQNILDRHIQAKACKYIYEYKIECDFVDPIFDKMVPFLTVKETLDLMQMLLNYDQLDYSMLGFYAMIKYVGSKTEKKRKRGRSKSKSTKKGKPEDIIELIENMTKQEVKKLYAPLPEVDSDENKYKVCYHCYKQKDKILILCPNCELVYFCSEQCNRLNLKKKTSKHKCKGLFYIKELKKMQERGSKEFVSRLDALLARRIKFLENPDFDFELRYAFSELVRHRSRKEKEEKAKSRSRSPGKKGKKGKKDKDKKGKGKKKSDKSTRTTKSRSRSPKSKSTKRSRSPKSKSTKRSKSPKRSRSPKGSKGRSKDRKKSKGREKSKKVKISKKVPRRGRSKIRGGKRGAKERDKSKTTKYTSTSRGRSKETGIRERDVSEERIEKEDKDMGLLGNFLGADEYPLFGDKYSDAANDMYALLTILNLSRDHLPCVILIEGQLYYKFGGGNRFCGLTYSHN